MSTVSANDLMLTLLSYEAFTSLVIAGRATIPLGTG